VSPRSAAASSSERTIAFQGVPGAYSDLACSIVYPEWTTLPCETFEDAFQAVGERAAKLAMIPIENSVAGRVADVHHLMPASGLHIIAEHFQRIQHQLLAPKGATLAGIKTVHSHVHALSQCRKFLRAMGLKAVVHADTAGAAADVARTGDPTIAAIASSLAAKRYGLDVLKADIEDAEHNTTRFLVLSRDTASPDPRKGPVMTSIVFRVRNVPAALYKAMGGFATNGINLTKLESYMLGGRFSATQFYADCEGHPEERNLRLALEELGFFSNELKILGVYPAHPFRYRAEASAED